MQIKTSLPCNYSSDVKKVEGGVACSACLSLGTHTTQTVSSIQSCSFIAIYLTRKTAWPIPLLDDWAEADNALVRSVALWGARYRNRRWRCTANNHGRGCFCLEQSSVRTVGDTGGGSLSEDGPPWRSCRRQRATHSRRGDRRIYTAFFVDCANIKSIDRGIHSPICTPPSSMSDA